MAEVPIELLTGSVLRAARALMGISAAQLASETSVGERTILRAESFDGPVVMREANARAIIAALERRGVDFIVPDDEGSLGLRRAVYPKAYSANE